MSACSTLAPMFIRTKTTPNSPRSSIQIVESVRVGSKVKQKIIRHVGVAMNDEELVKLKEVAEFIKAKLEAEHQPQLFTAEEVSEQAIEARKPQTNDQAKETLNVDLKQLREVQRSIIGIHEVYGEVYQQLGFGEIWEKSKRRKNQREILRQITLARIAQPESKRATVQFLERDFGVRLRLNTVYKTMDSIDEECIQFIQDKAYNATNNLLGGSLDVLFYDCTTLYFESFVADELRQKGYSKEHRTQETQVLLALLVSREGLPVGYELFPGATFEGKTLLPIVKSLKERLELNRVVFVADRGLFSQANLTALENANIEYVVGAKLKTQKKELKETILNKDNYQSLNDELTVQVIEQKDNRRLIISHSQKRARKNAHERLQSIEKLKQKLKKSKQPKQFLSTSSFKKYLHVPTGEELTINEQAIEESARWDGLHGVMTNSQEEVSSILEHYRGLWQVEESFRIQKHDLKVRPIYHWTESRIRAHIAIAFMSFSCVRHLEYRVALQYKKLSPAVIRRELAHVQVSLLEEKNGKSLYAMPSTPSPHAEKIYHVMGVKPPSSAYRIQ